MAFDLIIRDASVVCSTGSQVMDIAIEGHQIVGVGFHLGRAKREINAEGLHALPGLIDTQVHFREPGLTHKEDLESGTRAAIMGGVTMIFEMPNTNPTTTTPEALADKVARAEGRTWCDHGFFVGASTDNVTQLADYEMLPGTPGIKMFAGSSTGSLLVEEEDYQREVLQHGSRPVPIHSEDEKRLRALKAAAVPPLDVSMHPHLRDAEAARISTERMIRLCRETGRPIHILHVSTLDELPLLRAAKEVGLPVTCEVTPQHLTLEASLYATLGTKLQMNPPVRSEEHRAAIQKALEEGLFDVIGSDHAPHTLEEKANPYPESPSGMPGVQTTLSVMLGWVPGSLTLEKMVEMASERPATLYGIKNKGYIKEGYDADLVLVDPLDEFVPDLDWLQSKCGWSPYEGRTLRGKPRAVFLRGNQIVENSRLVGQPLGQSAQYTWK